MYSSTHCNLSYIRDIHTANDHCKPFKSTPLGFDLEWKPSLLRGRPENPVALVQLANKHTILLLQVSAMSDFPNHLKDILAAPHIVKVGVGIQYDVKKLYRDYAISTRNCVDLSLLARSVDNARWKGSYANPIGLARLVETYQQLTLPKGPVQRSNWEALLTNEQQQYAANDAHSALTVYNRLIEMAAEMTPIPKETYYTFDCINGRLCESSSDFTWYPNNPDYDPGPPPPPRIPKPPKASDVTVTEPSSDRPPRSQQRVPPTAHLIPVFGRGRGRFPPQSQPRSSHRFPSADHQPRYHTQRQPHLHPQTRFPAAPTLSAEYPLPPGEPDFPRNRSYRPRRGRAGAHAGPSSREAPP